MGENSHPAAQPPNIFISYRRADTEGHAGRLSDDLKERFGERVRVFMDFDSISAGEDFVKVIHDAVGSCHALIAMIGRNWLTVTDAKTGKRRLDSTNDHVRVEVASALKRNVRVIPVLVQGATMPSEDELPDDLKPLAVRNALEISSARWDYDVERLIQVLEKVLPPLPPPNGRGRERRFAGLSPAQLKKAGAALAAVAVVALVSYGVWPFVGGGNRNVPANDNAGGVSNSTTNPVVNSNANGGNSSSPPAVNSAPTSTPTPTPTVRETPTRDAVQVVRVLSSDRGLVAHGFFTPEGYIVTLAGAVQGRDEVRVVWRHGEREMRESAQVVRRGAAPESASFLKLKEAGLIRLPTPIRLSGSLTVNEAVERFLGSHDRTPGRVLKLRSESGGGGFGGMLVTTKISSGGDAGAPVVDEQGRIVAMVVGGSQTETLSIPVETLKLNFLEAF
jgi:hypothetical protein